MAAGQARTEFLRTGKKVRILDHESNPRWHDVWDHLPWLARPEELGNFASIHNHPGRRAYIDYPFTREEGCRYSGWRARDNLGGLIFDETEKAFAEKTRAEIGPYIVVEPNLTERTNPNKQWGLENWQQLADTLTKQRLTVVQVGAMPDGLLRGVRFVQTPTFRTAAAVLQKAQTAVLPEGGLHHAAGALQKRVVVLFGGAVDVNATGYDDHINIARMPACGKWLPCEHCRKIWDSIKPSEIVDTMLENLMPMTARNIDPHSENYVATLLEYIKTLIGHLRNRRGVDENWAMFEFMIQKNLDTITTKFTSRWLVSICDTYADYGSPASRRNALMISLFINMIRLSDTMYEDQDVRPGRIQQIKTSWPPFYSEMHAMHLDKQDTLLNLMKRLTRSLQDDKVMHSIFIALLRRAKENDNLIQRFMKHSARPEWVFPEDALEIADQYGIK